MAESSLTSESSRKRYEFHCVAPEVYGGPTPTDDLDEALLATASYVGSHWDIWDTVEHEYVAKVGSDEELAEVEARVAARVDPCMALVAEVAQDQCEAVASGWLNCAERETSGLMARGYRCRSCRACEVQKATTSDA